jgi:AcrR family transcriptional regulator
MARTRADLTAVARRLTAAHGLNGFTVEELCEQVGISRRTFFNYFHSKDDAIIGHSADFLDEDALKAFLSRRDDGTSRGLLQDLVDLSIAHVSLIGVTAAELAAFKAAVDKEPRLMERMISAGAEQDRAFVTIIEHREGFNAGDPRAETALDIVKALMHSAGQKFLDAGDTVDFPTLLQDALDSATAVFEYSASMSDPAN